jgi:hypothetical protein
VRPNFVNGKETHAHDDQGDSVAMACEMLSSLLYSQTSDEPEYATFTFS